MTDTGFFARDSAIATPSQTVFPFTFPFLASNHIKVSIDGVAEAGFTVAAVGVVLDGGFLLGGEVVRVYRESPDTVATLLFQATGPDHLGATDMDVLVKSLLYLDQEHEDRKKLWWASVNGSFTPDPAVATHWIVSGTNPVVTLPPAATWGGVEMVFVKEDPGGTLFIVPDGSETINGNALYSDTTDDATVTLSAHETDIRAWVSYALGI